MGSVRRAMVACPPHTNPTTPATHCLAAAKNPGMTECFTDCLSVKPPSPTDDFSQRDNEEISSLTLSEIQAWSESFERLMASLGGRRVFREFLRCEYSEENILFWMACEDLKKETSPEKVEEKARMIYEDYVSILSPREVSLDSRVREIINKNICPHPRRLSTKHNFRFIPLCIGILTQDLLRLHSTVTC